MLGNFTEEKTNLNKKAHLEKDEKKTKVKLIRAYGGCLAVKSR